MREHREHPREVHPFLLVDEELLDILALITLQLNHFSHLGVGDDGAIAGYSNAKRLDENPGLAYRLVQGPIYSPNFFLMTFRILR